jgi:hypothetical protein
MSSVVIPLTIFGDPLLCQQPQTIGSFPSIENYYWSNGDSTQNASATEVGALYLVAEDAKGCNAYSDTLFIAQGSVPPIPIITNLDAALVSSNGPNIQWFFNDNILLNDTNQVIFPNQYGFYSVSFTSEDGCMSYSTAYNWTALSLDELSTHSIKMFPNPSTNKITVQSEEVFSEIQISNSLGQRMVTKIFIPTNAFQFSVADYARGVYFVKIKLKSNAIIMKLIKE